MFATSLHQIPRLQAQEEICLSVARFYFPSSEAIESITETPVPQEFRDVHLNRDFCDGWILLEQSLLTTNLKYGDENSTTAALNYIESHFLDDSPSDRVATRQAKKRARLQKKLQTVLHELGHCNGC